MIAAVIIVAILVFLVIGKSDNSSWSPIDNSRPAEAKRNYSDPDVQPVRSARSRATENTYVPGEVTEHTRANLERVARGQTRGLSPEVVGWAKGIIARREEHAAMERERAEERAAYAEYAREGSSAPWSPPEGASSPWSPEGWSEPWSPEGWAEDWTPPDRR